MLRLPLVIALLSAAPSFAAERGTHLRAPSPGGRFELTFDLQAIPPLVIREGRFQRTEGPQLPEDFVTLAGWTGKSTLEVKGEKKAYTLKVTDEQAAFVR